MSLVLVRGIRVFDKARQVLRRLAHDHDRARVIHVHRPDHGYGAELALRHPVARRDERQRTQRGQLVLVADAHVHAGLGQRGAQHAQQKHAPLEQAHQPVQLCRIFDTPPVEVMITTITTWGCSASTSMWRIVAVLSEGAETTASRLVTCESVSVVTRIASSTSRRISDSSRPGGRASPSPEASMRSTM